MDDIDCKLDINTDNANDDIETANASSFAHFLSKNDALPSPLAMMSNRSNHSSSNRSRAQTLTIDNNITISISNSCYNNAHSNHNTGNNNVKDKPRRRSMVKNLHDPREFETILTTIVSNQEYVTPFSPRFGSKTLQFNYFG